MSETLPYRCAGCDSRDRPVHRTWNMESSVSDVVGVGVACSECTRLWGGTVVSRDLESEVLVDDNTRFAREVATPDSDLDQVYEELRVVGQIELGEEPSHRHECRHCGERVAPQSGWIPAADGRSVLSVVAEYCPECEAVLGVTWG